MNLISVVVKSQRFDPAFEYQGENDYAPAVLGLL